MYSYKIVPDGAAYFFVKTPDSKIECVTYEKALIPITSEWAAEKLKVLAEVTPQEWNIIFGYFIANEVVRRYYKDRGNTLQFETRGGISFSQYLSDLISLAPLKGLTIEQIKELKQ